MNPEPTYIFENGKVYAYVGGRVVASAVDIDELQEQLESPQEDASKQSHVIVSPNGLRGQILGRVKGLWGDEVTVRFENGHIRKLQVNNSMQFTGAVESDDPIEALGQRLSAEQLDTTRKGLERRREELEELIREAGSVASSSQRSDEEVHRLDQIIVQADAELGQINDGIRHLDHEETQAFEPPAPFDINVVEQGGPSQGATWLDRTLGDMVNEAENFDYERMMDEGPESFVAEQETPALGDAETTRQIATSFIRQHTAAADEHIRDKYERVWLARVEDCRKDEVARREAERPQPKEASTDEDHPDEALFT